MSTWETEMGKLFIRRAFKGIKIEILTRTVVVNRQRTVAQAINATGRIKHVDWSLAATMPVSEGPQEVRLVYARFDVELLPADYLESWLRTMRLVPDPQAQIDDNADDPAFADSHPNGIQWSIRGRPNYCALLFHQHRGRQIVNCYDDHRGWECGWWIAGREISPSV